MLTVTIDGFGLVVVCAIIGKLVGPLLYTVVCSVGPSVVFALYSKDDSLLRFGLAAASTFCNFSIVSRTCDCSTGGHKHD